MDRDTILQFAGSHFRSISSEPVRIQILNGVPHAHLSPEGDASLESTGDKPSELHIMASVNYFPPDDNNNSHNGGHYPSADANANGNSSITIAAKPAVRYHECMKNHAATMGGHAVDGCREFLPSRGEGLDALKCAACSCHRNFHHKEVEGSEHGCDRCRKNPRKILSEPPTPALLGMPTSRDMASHGHMMLPLNSPHSDDPTIYPSGSSSQKRRRRTIFSLEQKEKMFYFAESLGWKISKHNEDSVQGFCDDVGVHRHVFRVWMHNHKHNMRLSGELNVDGKCEGHVDF